jgi:hypothetical protein
VLCSFSTFSSLKLNRAVVRLPGTAKYHFKGKVRYATLFSSYIGQALNEAHQCGLDIIIKEGMANGRLLHPPHDSPPSTRLLTEMASKYECSVDSLALAVVLLQPFQPMVLSGAANVAHLRSVRMLTYFRNIVDLMVRIGCYSFMLILMCKQAICLVQVKCEGLGLDGEAQVGRCAAPSTSTSTRSHSILATAGCPCLELGMVLTRCHDI